MFLHTGYILGEPLSSISGFILEGRLFGSIYRQNLIHFLEPYNPKPTILLKPGNRTKNYLTLFHTINELVLNITMDHGGSK